MISSPQTYSKVLGIVKLVLRMSDGQHICLESDLTKDLAADSADLAGIILDVEDEFKIVIEDELITNIKTIADIVAVVEQELKDVGAP